MIKKCFSIDQGHLRIDYDDDYIEPKISLKYPFFYFMFYTILWFDYDSKYTLYIINYNNKV